MDSYRCWRDFALKGNGKVGNNTFVSYNETNGDATITLHSTPVVTWHPDGSVTYRTGGWVTKTTKDRLNAYGHPNHAISQRRGKWYIHFRDADRTEPLDEGGTYGPSGLMYFGGTTPRPVVAA